MLALWLIALTSVPQIVGETCGLGRCTPVFAAPPPPFADHPAAAAAYERRLLANEQAMMAMRAAGDAVFAALDAGDLRAAYRAQRRLVHVVRAAQATIARSGFVDEVRRSIPPQSDPSADLNETMSVQQFFNDQARGLQQYVEGRRSAIIDRERMGMGVAR